MLIISCNYKIVCLRMGHFSNGLVRKVISSPLWTQSGQWRRDYWKETSGIKKLSKSSLLSQSKQSREQVNLSVYLFQSHQLNK